MSVHVEQWGDGPDVVLVHGWGLHSGVWSAVTAQLAQSFRVWLLDLPGHGRSPKLSGDATLATYAQALLEALPERATWIGWSLGAMTTLAAAHLAPDHCERLVLVAGTPRFITDLDWSSAIAPSALYELECELADDSEQALRRFAALQFGASASERAGLRQLRDELFRYGLPNIDALNAGLRILQTADLRPLLPTLNVRSLVIHGDEDRLVPAAAGAYLARALPQATFRRMPHVGHAPFLSKPEEFGQVVEDFLHDRA